MCTIKVETDPLFAYDILDITKMKFWNLIEFLRTIMDTIVISRKHLNGIISYVGSLGI